MPQRECGGSGGELCSVGNNTRGEGSAPEKGLGGGGDVAEILRTRLVLGGSMIF